MFRASLRIILAESPRKYPTPEPPRRITLAESARGILQLLLYVRHESKYMLISSYVLASGRQDKLKAGILTLSSSA